MAKKEKERAGFVFYYDWIRLLRKYPPEIRHAMRDWIDDYVLDGKQPNFAGNIDRELLFETFKGQIDRDLQKYKDIQAKRSEAGQKGRRVQVDVEQMTANGSKCQQMTANGSNINTITDTIEITNTSTNTTPINRGDIYNIAPPPYESLVNSQEIVQKARDFIQFYNQQVQGTHLPTARITGTRIMKTAHILAKIGVEDMRDAIIKASQSILAKEPSGIGYDWLTNEDNIVKVIEGNYDNTRTNTQSPGLRSQEARRKLQLQQLARGDEQLLADLEATLQNGG